MPMLIKRKQYEAVLRMGLRALKVSEPDLVEGDALTMKAQQYQYSSKAVEEIMFLQRKVSIYNAIHKLFK